MFMVSFVPNVYMIILATYALYIPFTYLVYDISIYTIGGEFFPYIYHTMNILTVYTYMARMVQVDREKTLFLKKKTFINLTREKIEIGKKIK